MRRLSTFLRQSAILQALVIFAIWAACDAGVRAVHGALPPSILAIGVLLALLLSGLLQPGLIQRGARLWLADILLFFVPAVPAVLTYPEFSGWLGAKILLVIALGTVLVMAATALAVEWAFRLGGFDDQ